MDGFAPSISSTTPYWAPKLPAARRAAIGRLPKFIGGAGYLYTAASINSAWYPASVLAPYFAKNKRPATDAGQFLRKIVSSIKRFIIQVYFRHLVEMILQLVYIDRVYDVAMLIPVPYLEF